LRHRHARDARITVSREFPENVAIARGKLLENDQGNSRGSAISFQDLVKGVSPPFFISRRAGGEMTFAGRVADHEQTHGQETGKALPNFFDRSAQRRNSFHEILLDEEYRLNGAHVSGAIFQKQVM